MGIVDHPPEQAAQMTRKPAEGEDQHQGEDGFSYFPALRRESELREDL